MHRDPLDELCAYADDFYARGDAFGGTGNLSLRREDRVWMTPTGKPLKGLTPDLLASLRLDGTAIGENRPSKEYPFHLNIYRARPDAGAVVHLHAPHTVALSCLRDLDAEEPIPAFTPYFVMRVAPLGLVDYHRPGSDALADAIGTTAADHDCMLLRNHGSVCIGRNFSEAADRAIELEETARLYFMLRHHDVRHLTDDEIDDLHRTFGST